MMRIAICDDKKICREEIVNHIIRYQKEFNMELWYQEYDSGKKFLEDLNKDYDVVFLDIRMPDLSGEDAAKILRERDSKMQIVFMSFHEDGVYTGYEVGASNYLRKPVGYETIKKELDKIILKIQKEERTYISIKNDTGIYKLFLEEIRFIETHGDKICVHYENKKIICSYTLKELEKKLPSKQFIRSHVSYLVNLRFVSKMERVGKRYDFILITGEEVPLSRNKKNECLNLIGEYMFQGGL